MNYEINDLLIKKDKQYNLHRNVIIKLQKKYNEGDGGVSLVYKNNSTDDTRIEPITLLDGNALLVTVVTFYFNSITINLHSQNQIDEWTNIIFHAFEVYIENLRDSDLRFRHIQHITIQTSLSTKTRGGSYIQTHAIIANKKGATVNIMKHLVIEVRNQRHQPIKNILMKLYNLKILLIQSIYRQILRNSRS